MTENTPLLTTQQVVELTGVSFRKLQWWHERGYLEPALIKNVRRYTLQEASLALVIEKLREKRVPFRRIKAINRILLLRKSDARYLCVTPTRMLLIDDQRSLIDVVRRAHGCHVVEIEKIEQLRKAAA